MIIREMKRMIKVDRGRSISTFIIYFESACIQAMEAEKHGCLNVPILLAAIQPAYCEDKLIYLYADRAKQHNSFNIHFTLLNIMTRTFEHSLLEILSSKIYLYTAVIQDTNSTGNCSSGSCSELHTLQSRPPLSTLIPTFTLYYAQLGSTSSCDAPAPLCDSVLDQSSSVCKQLSCVWQQLFLKKLTGLKCVRSTSNNCMTPLPHIKDIQSEQSLNLIYFAKHLL